jgi:hypothetical protein
MTNINETPVNDEVPDEQECSWCEDRYPTDEMTTHTFYRGFWNRRNGNDITIHLCEDCECNAAECTDCTAIHDTYNSDAIVVNHYDRVCEECAGNYNWCDNHEEYYRDECSDCESERSDLIHDYSFRPEPQFFIVRKDGSTASTSFGFGHQTVTGFELEMEASECDLHEGAELASSIYDKWCYLKHDGSLNDGFEMVSHPLSREFITEHFPWHRLSELSALGMRSANTRTCGLHVHINKDFFQKNPTTMYRFMSMFYRNAEQWKKIAGRSESSYASWSEYELERMLDYTKGMAVGAHVRNNDRYVALNLQNRNTIELRFFKGTLRPQTFIARLEAAHAVAEYAYTTRNAVSIKSAHDWERFREWTIQQKKYTNFNTYAESKGV